MNESAPKVFIVDDDAAVRDSSSLLIELEGYTVETYASAAAFLAACGPKSRGCAIIDLRMPGMGGLQLQEEMARRGFVLPIIFLTAYADTPTSVTALKAGAVAFLSKPITTPDLLRNIAATMALAKEA